MAYEGYLIKVGNFTIPNSMIRAETYNVTRNGQDLESYRDADGILHRNALDHTAVKVEFETPALKTDKDYEVLLGGIQRNYIIPKEKKVHCRVYVAETREYVECDMYIPDIKMSIYSTHDGVILYNQTRIAFIEY